MHRKMEGKAMTCEYLCEVLRTHFYLEHEEIDAILADGEFFQPYLREALRRRAELDGVPEGEDPIDQTDFHAIFLLSHLGDASILPDLLRCLSFNDDDLWLLYSDILTEDMWLPVALVAQNEIENLWDYVIDDSKNRYARAVVVWGLIAMAVLSPETRSRVIQFIRKLLDHRDVFEEHWLGGILCDCGDHGLDEVKDQAYVFADTMEEEKNYFFLGCTPDEVKKSFQGRIFRRTQERLNDTVYSLNQVWKNRIRKNEEYERRDKNKTFDLDNDLISSAPAKKFNQEK